MGRHLLALRNIAYGPLPHPSVKTYMPLKIFFCCKNNPLHRDQRKLTKDDQGGFTLIELMTAVAIIATLAAIATINILGYRERAKVAVAITDLKAFDRAILIYVLENGSLPTSLQQAGLGNPVDPWGNPYVYAPVDSVPKGKLRKDKSLVPINTDYDLYSKGADGTSVAPLTAKASQDDIVRANNGAFIGIAKNY